MRTKKKFLKTKKTCLNKPLIKALASQDTSLIENLVRNGANVNYQDTNGNTPLHKVTDVKILKLLIELGADVNVKNKYQNTAVHHIVSGRINQEKCLKKEKRKKNFESRRALIQELLKYGPLLNEKNKQGNTVLFDYIRMNECHIDVVKDMLSNGGDLHTLSTTGDTLLHIAVNNPLCNLNVVKLLLGLGLDPNNANQSRDTPLHHAVRAKFPNVDVIKELLKYGANVLFPNKSGHTPFLLSVLNPNCTTAILKELLSLDMSDSMLGLCTNGTIIPDVVSHSGNAEVIDELIKKLIGFCKLDEDCLNNALIAAALRPDCSCSLVTTLIKYGAKVNSLHESGASPLILALKCVKDFNVIVTLIKHGASVNIVDRKSYTVLHAAIENEDKKFIIKLLSFGHNFKFFKDCFHLSSQVNNLLSFCMSQNKIPCAKILMKYLVMHNNFEYESPYPHLHIPSTIKVFFWHDLLSPSSRNLYNFMVSCLDEIALMKKDYILHVNCYDLLVKEFSAEMLSFKLNRQKRILIIQGLLDKMDQNRYPEYKNFFLYTRKSDFLEYLNTFNIYVRKSKSYEKVNIPSCVVDHLTKFLSKEDVINLITVYSNISDCDKDIGKGKSVTNKISSKENLTSILQATVKEDINCIEQSAGTSKSYGRKSSNIPAKVSKKKSNLKKKLVLSKSLKKGTTLKKASNLKQKLQLKKKQKKTSKK